jgi:putative flippase GtrA
MLRHFSEDAMNKKEWLRSLKFLLFSISAGIIQLGGFALLNELLHLDYWVSYLIALVASVLWNFTFNRRYTFKSDGNVARAMLLVFVYYCVFTPLSTMLEHYLADTMGWNEYLVTVINMVLNFVTEFLYQRFVVYRKSLDTNKFAK